MHRPLGNDYRDQKLWRCDLRLYPDERTGYFRWGDESPRPRRSAGPVFDVDSLATVGTPVFAAHTLRLSAALLAAGRPHEVLPLPGATHLVSDQAVTENLLLHQLDFLQRALGLPRTPGLRPDQHPTE